MDIELNIVVPTQRKDIEESANNLPEAVSQFIEMMISAVVTIHDNIPRESLVTTLVRDANAEKPWMYIPEHVYPLSDNRMTEILCSNRLIASIYQRRDDFNFVETTFFVSYDALEKIRTEWLGKKTNHN